MTGDVTLPQSSVAILVLAAFLLGAVAGLFLGAYFNARERGDR